MNNYQNDKKWFSEILKNKNLVQKIKNIKTIITDIDGCLTDGCLMLSENKYPEDNDFSRSVTKKFDVQDGFAISKIIKANSLSIAFLTGRTDEATKIRAQMLGIPENLCFTGIYKKKIEKVKEIQQKTNSSKKEILYFGDDFLDYEVIEEIGVMSSPINTPFYFQDKSDIVVPRNGGSGAFRLLLDLVLYIQNKHFAQNFIEESLNL